MSQQQVANMTVALITIRQQPHFDWFFQGLSQQQIKPLELIIIDDRNTLERYMECQALAARYGIRLAWYGHSKPSRWTGKRPALCNARNTALAVMNTPYIAFHDDNGISDPNWIRRHAMWANYGMSCGGTWFTFQHGIVKDTVKGFSNGPRYVMEGEPGPYGWEARKRNVPNGVMAAPSDWLHGGNMGFLLEAALAVNGFDEDYDGEQGCDDCDFGIRLRRAGYKNVFDADCIVYYSLDSHALTQNEVPADKPDKALLERMSMAREPKKKMLLDGKLHFSNEYLTQCLNQGLRPTRANPHFNLQWLREQWKEKFKVEAPLGAEKDWRDDQLISEMG